MSFPFSHVQICICARIMMAAASQHPADKAASPIHINICTQATEDSELYCSPKKWLKAYSDETIFLGMFVFLSYFNLNQSELNKPVFSSQNLCFSGILRSLIPPGQECLWLGIYIEMYDIVGRHYSLFNICNFDKHILRYGSFPIQVDCMITNSCPGALPRWPPTKLSCIESILVIPASRQWTFPI